MPRAATKKIAPKAATTEPTVEKSAEKVEATTPSPSKQAYIVKKDIPLNTIVTVRNGFDGQLIYKSQRTHERFVWDAFGDEQDMEYQELRNAKNSQKSYFENNWFLIDDPEIIQALGVERLYENALTYDEFDSLFTMSADEIADRISKLSNGQKASVKYRAKQLIEEGAIDSIKVINTLEKCLGVDLIER